MSGEGSRLSLYVFVLVLNIVFPVYGYAFSTFPSTYGFDYDVSLSEEDLAEVGITLVDADLTNLTFGAGYQVLYVQNKTFRMRWDNVPQGAVGPVIPVTRADGIEITTPSAVGMALDKAGFGLWTLSSVLAWKSVITNQWRRVLTNDSIVNEWSDEYNWTRVKIETGHWLFVTPRLNHNNITLAVYGDSQLNITLAQSFEESTNFNFWRFVTWYSSLMIGLDSYGLPSFFQWIIRILGGISTLALVLIAKEMTRV